jgi:4a-hydroxytetrahydrobiopterin dehydratase
MAPPSARHVFDVHIGLPVPSDASHHVLRHTRDAGGDMERITPAQFTRSDGVADWRVLSEGACALFRVDSFATGARFVEAVSRLDGLDEQHAGIDLRPDSVSVRLLTTADDYWGLSERDVLLAREISSIAREQGLVAEPSSVQTWLVVPGAPDTSAVMPFWRAVLGYEPRADSPQEDLVDPDGIGPGFWFEPMDEPRADGGGAIHIAVWVAPEEAEARVAAAVAAGGRIVRDEFAPAWWTLADAAGNEADVATTTGRE